MPSQLDGASLIAAERERQVTVEGWSPEHDDAHTNCDLARAAIAYLSPASNRRWWPWDRESFKPVRMTLTGGPGERIPDLVKAGALVAAEIDRLARAEVAR